MPITQLGLHGPQAAYQTFQAKSAATVIVLIQVTDMAARRATLTDVDSGRAALTEIESVT